MARGTPSASRPFVRLRKRDEFVAAAKGRRFNADSFGLQAKARAEVLVGPPRFGITVTKKTAPRAVDRNRIRRRLREALRLGAALSGAPGHDYVIVGRHSLLAVPFGTLRAALTSALTGVAQRVRGSAQARQKV